MKSSAWITFVALCLLSSSAWVFAPLAASTLPSLERQSLCYFIIGFGALLVSGTKSSLRTGDQSWGHLTIAGLGFFGLPAIAIESASTAVPDIGRSALFAMVPVVVVVVLTATEAEESGARRSLVPALTALGGLLLLLPLNFTNSPRGIVMLAVICAAVILVGLSSVSLFRLLPAFKLSDAAAVISLSNATFLLLISLCSRAFVWRRDSLASLLSLSSIIEVIEALLLLWLVRVMPPIRFATRYLLVPLLTVLEGYFLLRPELTVRIVAGTGLLAIGSGMLLFLNSVQDQVALSLR